MRMSGPSTRQPQLEEPCCRGLAPGSGMLNPDAGTCTCKPALAAEAGKKAPRPRPAPAANPTLPAARSPTNGCPSYAQPIGGEASLGLANEGAARALREGTARCGGPPRPLGPGGAHRDARTP